jgi:SAM-dependent methyltransferase
MNVYDERYFEFIERASIESARQVLPVVMDLFHPHSVVDFGCGQGAWLRVWKDLGVTKVLGVDGDYVNRQSLLIAQAEFRSHDLQTPLDLSETFDLALCLEVAEHLPIVSAAALVQTLTRHSRLVLFSAAVPGQGGYRHINEQPYEYWRSLFARHDYCLVDIIRPRIQRVRSIEPWYAYNTFIFAERAASASLPRSVTDFIVTEGAPIRDYSPALFRVRKALLRPLPERVIDALHVLKKHSRLALYNRRRRQLSSHVGDGT